MVNHVQLNVSRGTVISGVQLNGFDAKWPHAHNHLIQAHLGKQRGKESKFHSVLASSLEFFQIRCADSSAFERWPIPLVLLDIVVFHPADPSRRENSFPVNRAVTDFRERI